MSLTPLHFHITGPEFPDGNQLGEPQLTIISFPAVQFSEIC